MDQEGPQHERQYREAMGSLQATLADFDRATEGERDELSSELERLREMDRKLEAGRVDIAVLGEISTGKSALINALAGERLAEVGVKGGTTQETGRVGWDGVTYSLPGMGESRVELIDTPGLNEVAGEERAAMSRAQAQRSDLLLFVTDSDFNDLEMEALRELADATKPVIIVLNKADLYGRAEREKLLAVLRERAEGLVAAEHVVAVAADPMEREYVIEAADGSTREEVRKPPPDVEDLKLRILSVLEREGKALVALNGSMFATGVGDRLRAVKVRMRDEQARRLIRGFAVIKGAAVALNPVPVADVVGGFGSDAAMVAALGRVYGEQVTLRGGGRLAIELAESLGWVALAEWATHAAAALVKTTTLGAGIVITALPQGLAAAYGSYLVGQGAKYYFEHDRGWGGRSPRQVVREIIRNTDNQSVLRQLRDDILEKLHADPRARKEENPRRLDSIWRRIRARFADEPGGRE